MKSSIIKSAVVSMASACLVLVFLASCAHHKQQQPVIEQTKLASQYFGEDAQWYLDNIPFFECSDKQIEQVYYYRWKMYKAHIRSVGDNSFVITEFINHVPWDREPFCTINAASMHHIYEGRWLKDQRIMDGYINYLFQNGGNDRRYSESVADAAYARYLVNADREFIVRQLDSMKQTYNAWSDHWDSEKNLYYIPAMPDATEYTIASIDASGGTGGFDDGEAFRPTINSYMYGNAMAISHIAKLAGDEKTSDDFLQKATPLKQRVETDLWNDSLQHFTDRFKVSNQYVHYWNFIRGRELAGFAPWYFDLPSDTKIFNSAWQHATDTSDLLGQYGLRTNEPSYEYYFKQIVFFEGQPGSQWNGPSWPYQTSQALTGMANMLNNYKQDVITPSDYLKLLRLYTNQHYLPNGKLDLVENYDPNKGGPIVYYYWSNHYNHSSYNNLVISGLCGIRPSESDTLTLNPLVDSSIQYFCLDNVLYHGHKLTIVYDKSGSKYNLGKGVTIMVDDKKMELKESDGKYKVYIGAAAKTPTVKQPVNLALNISKKEYPLPTASVNATPDSSLFQAIDGRIWYFPEITNRWTTEGSNAMSDWFALDFGTPKQLSSVKMYFFTDENQFSVPDSCNIEYQSGSEWLPVKAQPGARFIGNTVNTISFEKITAARVRLNFKHRSKQVAISEVECY
jgi:hypothetical protein